jgi:hypothetical protein
MAPEPGQAGAAGLLGYTFRATEAGAFTVSVFDGASHIRHSPLALTVLPGTSGSGLCKPACTVYTAICSFFSFLKFFFFVC